MRLIMLGLSILSVSFIFAVGGLFSFAQWSSVQAQSKQEKSVRVSILREAFFAITWHNVKYYMGKATYKMDKTPLSIMNETEYLRILRPVPTELYYVTKPFQHTESVPVAVDWRKTGLLNKEDAAQLNSSSNSIVLQWALDTRPLLEGNLPVVVGRNMLRKCAEKSTLEKMQHCVDTSDLRQITYNFRSLETIRKEQLRSRAEKKFIDIPESVESYLHKAVMKGPVMAAIHAPPNFRHYKSGVFFDANCHEDQVNYAVLIVGYGTDEDFGDYWLVKTTWGPDFGENGYARIARNRNNHCGIASFVYVDEYYRFHNQDDEPTSLLWDYYASDYKTDIQKFKNLEMSTLKTMEDEFWETLWHSN